MSRKPDLLHPDLSGLAHMPRDIDMLRIHADMRELRTHMYRLADMHWHDDLSRNADM